MKRVIFLLMVVGINVQLGAQVSLNINPDTNTVAISERLIGAFFEDINYGADGGLYAELIQNRSFEYYQVERWVDTKPLMGWGLELTKGAVAEMQIESSEPLNGNNPHYLHLSISKNGNGVGIRNTGFDMIAIDANEEYQFSFFVRSAKPLKKGLKVYLENSDREQIGSLTIDGINENWKKFSGTIKSAETDKYCNLVIMAQEKGDLYFDMVSLFPSKTFKERKNGLRADLAQTIADMQPRFLRFPGGCISHGRGLDNAYRWKETVGPVEQRTPNYNLWGYHQTYGIGFFEYFQYCEDIGAIPLPVVPVGVSCQFRQREVAPLDDMQIWIDDALDLVEFANGSPESEWGKVRAEMGHPASFNMEYICLGNEEDDIPEFRIRMKMVTDSLRKYYPEIKIIGTSGTAAAGRNYDGLWEYSKEEKLDAVDEHYYVTPGWLIDNLHRYDDFDRNGPKVFIGEYASWGNKMENALAEAAYLTGVERNADIVEFTCYAPLLSNAKHVQWNTDLIWFNNTEVVKTPNYYVQQLFSQYGGGEYVPSELSFDENYNPSTEELKGMVGVGTWNTQAQFDDLKVLSGNQVLLSQPFDREAEEWNVFSGDFEIKNGAYLQKSGAQPALSAYKIKVDTNIYTYTLRAMKTGGNEGFLIPFAMVNAEDNYWLNIGGWGNTRHAIQEGDGGAKAELVNVKGSIENNVWYDIKIDVTKDSILCYLNNELLFKTTTPSAPVASSVVRNKQTGELIVKLVNTGEEVVMSNIDIAGMDENKTVKVVSLIGKPELFNSLSQPNAVEPQSSQITVKDLKNYSLPAYSFIVLSIKE